MIPFDFPVLQLRRKFKIKGKKNEMNVCGCTILPNANVLFADYDGNNVIMKYNENGRHIRDISASGKPFDFTVIDCDRIAVSYSKYVEILNIKINKVLAKVPFKWACSGISYQNGKNYILVVNEGIVEIDMSGSRLRTIGGKYAGPCVNYICTSKDRIYCTDSDNNLVYCCSMTGEDIWTFTDKSLDGVQGISEDCNQNLFVVGRNSEILLIIQYAGKVSKQVANKI